MTHDEALELQLAGGPLPAEAALHLQQCPVCRSELVTLRSMEERLRAAAPSPHIPAGMEGRVLARLVRPRRSGWAAGSAAAALLLAAGLWAALLAPGFRSPSPVTFSPSAPPQAVVEFPAPPDTTAALLEAYEPVMSASQGQVSPEAIQSLLSPSEDGGSNG